MSFVFLVPLLIAMPLFYYCMAAVCAKRYHDLGKSGLYTLIALVPFGIIWVLIELGCRSGTPGLNKYGPKP